MKPRLMIFWIAAAASSFMACASQEAYRAYTEAVVQANRYRVQPGIEQTFDSEGRITSQKIIMPDQSVMVSQIKDSEWAAPATTALSLGVFGLSNWAITHEMAGAIKATQPNVSTNLSSGGHMSGGNMDASTTSAVTETTTSAYIPNEGVGND
ncbi:MAG: hypothetical protein AB7U43_09740 [Desulfobacter sp.]